MCKSSFVPSMNFRHKQVELWQSAPPKYAICALILYFFVILSAIFSSGTGTARPLTLSPLSVDMVTLTQCCHLLDTGCTTGLMTFTFPAWFCTWQWVRRRGWSDWWTDWKPRRSGLHLRRYGWERMQNSGKGKGVRCGCHRARGEGRG